MTSPSNPSSRAMHAPPKAPMTGRDVELGELNDALGRAIATKRPQAVTLVGAAGTGKSRLIQEFLQRVRERERRVQSFRGVCRQGGPAFGAIQRILRARFGIIEAASHEATLESFRTAVTEALGDKRVTEFLHFLGAFLELRYPESPFIKAVEDDAEGFARVSRAVLRRFFEVDAEKHPLILTFEDLQFASNDTLDVVEYLIRSLQGAPIVVVASTRPELLARRADWFSSTDAHARIDLAPLAKDDAEQLLMHLLAPTGDPPMELVEAGVEMAGGSPYLLEQMVRTFLDNGTLLPRPDGTWGVDLEQLDQAELPLTVEEAIQARISALAPRHRSVLEMAATMGGVFWLGALVAIERLDRSAPPLWGGAEDVAAHLRDSLAVLEERDFVLRLPDSTILGDVEYAFKHNLERELVHLLTSAASSKRFHLRIAEWLEFRLVDRTEESAELLAQHYERGDAKARAAAFYIEAGDRARARFANARAAEYYARGLALLGEDDAPRRIDALHHYGDVLQLLGRNDESIAAFRSMQALAYHLDLKGKGGAAHNRIGRVYRAIGHLDDAMRHLGTAQALFEAAGDERGIASCLDDIGKVHWMRGAYDAAERFMTDALMIRKRLGDLRSIALSHNNLGLVYQDSGRFGPALAAFHDALMIRREINDVPGIAQTLNNLGTIHQDNGDHERASQLWTEALELAREVGDRMRQAVVMTNLGESAYRLRRPADAIRLLKQADDVAQGLGDRILEGEILRGLAKSHMLVHDFALARDYIARSIALFEQARGKPYLAVALRTLGEITAAGGWGGADHARARDALEQSIHIFTELGNDIEIARSCDVLATFLESGDATEDDRRVAGSLRDRSAEIHARLRASDAEPAPLEGETTKPGTNADEMS